MTIGLCDAGLSGDNEYATQPIECVKERQLLVQEGTGGYIVHGWIPVVSALSISILCTLMWTTLRQLFSLS